MLTILVLVLGVAAVIASVITNKVTFTEFERSERYRRSEWERAVREYGAERVKPFEEKVYSPFVSKSHYTYGFLAFVGIFLVTLAFESAYTVTSGEKAVVLRFGAVQKVAGEGLNFKTPLIERIVKVDIKTKKAEAPANAGTKDLQNVDTKVALNFHINQDRVGDIFTNFGLNVEEKIIDPRIQETVKAVVARYSAEQLLSQRESVKKEIANMLRTQLASYYIVVEDIQITNFHFSDSFNKAIEAKQTAEQEAMKAENDLKRVKIEAEQKVAMAQAEAEQIRIQAEAVRAQGGKEYVQLKAIEKWNGTMPQYVGGGAPVPFIDVSK